MGSTLPANGKWLIALVAAVLGSAGGAGGGTYLYFNSLAPQQVEAIARPDPAYGSEVREIEEELESHLRNHPDRNLDLRISLLERDMERLRMEMERLRSQ